MISKKANKVVSVGGLYTPPEIKQAPEINEKEGIATITLVTTLTDKETKSFRTAFENYCHRKGLGLTMRIRGVIVTIYNAARAILMDVLRYLEVTEPQPKALPATTSKKPPVVMKSRKPHHFRYFGNGLGLAR